jgi:hypothetical protein
MNLKRTLLVLLLSGAFIQVKAQLFSQNFDKTDKLAKYVSAKPDAAQFDMADAAEPATIAIEKGKLKLARTGPGGRPFLVRTTPLNSKTDFVQFSFKISTKGTGDAMAYVAVGDGFNNQPLPDDAQKTAVRLIFKLQADGFVIRNTQQQIDGAGKHVGEQQLTWVINRSGKNQTYTAPDGSKQTIANHKWDLWVGNKQEFKEGQFTNPAQPLANFKFSFLSSLGEVTLDDMLIKDIEN